MNTQLFRFAGWSAYLNAVAGVIGFVSLFVFFAVGGLLGIQQRHFERILFPVVNTSGAGVALPISIFVSSLEPD